MRLRVKAKSFLSLFHLNDDDGRQIDKHLVNLVLSCQCNSVLRYLPNLEDKYVKIRDFIESESQDIKELWSKTKDIEDKKQFAMSVKDSPYSGLFFSMFKLEKNLRTEELIEEMKLNSEEAFLKRWKNANG